MELHVTWNLCRESIEQVVLTPDTFTERAELPPAESLRGDLLLADRGYFDREYLHAVATHGGYSSTLQSTLNVHIPSATGAKDASPPDSNRISARLKYLRIRRRFLQAASQGKLKRRDDT